MTSRKPWIAALVGIATLPTLAQAQFPTPSAGAASGLGGSALGSAGAAAVPSAAGVAAPASVNGLTFVGWQEPIACGGCAIFPGDIIVVDDDGAVVIPKGMEEFVAHEGAEHELYESWVFSEVEKGVKLPGLYPPNDDAKARYQAWRKSRS